MTPDQHTTCPTCGTVHVTVTGPDGRPAEMPEIEFQLRAYIKRLEEVLGLADRAEDEAA